MSAIAKTKRSLRIYSKATLCLGSVENLTLVAFGQSAEEDNQAEVMQRDVCQDVRFTSGNGTETRSHGMVKHCKLTGKCPLQFKAPSLSTASLSQAFGLGVHENARGKTLPGRQAFGLDYRLFSLGLLFGHKN
jgi:hypothetical protein